MANHRKMSQDVYRDRTLMQTISHSQHPGLISQSAGSGGSGSASANNLNLDEDGENITVALSQTGLQTPL
ncbi:hypothetical protein V3C99_010875 [Haemonchus contortus]